MSSLKQLALEAAAVFELRGRKEAKNLLTPGPNHIFYWGQVIEAYCPFP